MYGMHVHVRKQHFCIAQWWLRANDYEEEKTRTFLSYFEQNANFNSKEKSKSENLAFGYDIKSNINNLSIKSLIGISSNKITDIETESGQIKRKHGFLKYGSTLILMARSPHGRRFRAEISHGDSIRENRSLHL